MAKTPTNCRIPECDKKSVATQLCNRHYYQQREVRKTNPDFVIEQDIHFFDYDDLWRFVQKELGLMDYYDFSDTLAKVDWNSGNIPNAIRNAKPIYKPRGAFSVITAQQDNPAIHAAVKAWLLDHYPDTAKRVYFVSGSELNIIKGKIRILKDQGATSFSDNNTNILKAIKAEMPSLDLYQVNASGERTRY